MRKVDEFDKETIILALVGILWAVGLPVAVGTIICLNIEHRRYNLQVGEREYTNVRKISDHYYLMEDDSTLIIGENETFTLKEIK